MGVPGLLVGLKSFAVKDSIHSYANQSLAVDLSGWLHKSVYSIADHFVEEQQQQQHKEQPSQTHEEHKHRAAGGGHGNRRRPGQTTGAAGAESSRSLDVSSSYVIQRCHELLRVAGVAKIYLVLDGRRCPMKTVTNDERERRRQENLAQARYHRDRGEREKAFEKYKACIKVPSELAEAVAQRVGEEFQNDRRVQGRVEVVRSPYEADAQLVQLVLDGTVHAVVTEDSDVLVYQAACHVHFPVIFKLDRNSGTCDVLSMEWLLSPGTCRSAPWNRRDGPESRVSLLDAVLKTLADREDRDPGLGARLFVQSCVLTGCDYSPNVLSGVGLVNAFKLVRNSVHRSDSDRFRHALEQLPPKAKHSLGNNKIEYEELLARSEAVFYHHMVWQQPDGNLAFLGDHSAIPCHGHKPDMDRFGGDWSFLGDVSCDEDGRVRPGPLREMDDASNGPASQNDESAPAGAATIQTHRQPQALVLNPYQKSRKRPRHQRPSPERRPLAPIENTARPSTKADGTNPFSKFRCPPEPTKEETDPIFAKCRVYKGDPRFVNPTSFDDILRCASRRSSVVRRDAEGATSCQRGSLLPSKENDMDRRLPSTDAPDRLVQHHSNSHIQLAAANTFPYDGSSSRRSNANHSHESIDESERLSRGNASHFESLQRPLSDAFQFPVDHVAGIVAGHRDEVEANASVFEVPHTSHAETAPSHASVDSTLGFYARSVPDPQPPTSPRDARPFPYYDHDFMCSPDPVNYAMSNEELLADDIADESPPPAPQPLPAAVPHRLKGLAARTSQFFDPKPPSTLGPAKTIRPSLHHMNQTQTGGLKRFQTQRQQPPPPRAFVTQRHQPPSSSARGAKRVHSSGEKKNRSILEFLSRR